MRDDMAHCLTRGAPETTDVQRRDFLKQAGGALFLAAATGGTGWYFHNRDTTGYRPPVRKSHSFAIEPDATLPTTVIARAEDHVLALNRALDGIGGIGRFVKAGERVTIKPNVGWDRTPEQAADTNPVIVAEVVRLCLKAGAARVIVTDNTCNEARRCFARSGIQAAAEKAGGVVVLPTSEEFVTVDLDGRLLTEWPVLRHCVDTDRLINMPIVKQHSLSSCTIGMKNLYGILGGMRHRLHQEIDQSIVDLAAFCGPTLTIVDATRVLTRNGPQGGSLDDVAIRNSVICSTDQVGADARAAEFLELEAENVGHILLAQQAGLGSVDYRSEGYKEIL